MHLSKTALGRFDTKAKRAKNQFLKEYDELEIEFIGNKTINFFKLNKRHKSSLMDVLVKSRLERFKPKVKYEPILKKELVMENKVMNKVLYTVLQDNHISDEEFQDLRKQMDTAVNQLRKDEWEKEKALIEKYLASRKDVAYKKDMHATTWGYQLLKNFLKRNNIKGRFMLRRPSHYNTIGGTIFHSVGHTAILSKSNWGVK